MQGREQEELASQEQACEEAFFKGLTEFLKWTSTVALAAILWIANALGSSTGITTGFSTGGLLLLVFSVVLAILMFTRALAALARKWAYIREWQKLGLIQIAQRASPPMQTLVTAEEQIEKALDATEASSKLAGPQPFSVLIILHTVSLLTGLLLYAVGQILQRLPATP
jgi:ABC-type multidrug transport system fused ATPase/permease subunit